MAAAVGARVTVTTSAETVTAAAAATTTSCQAAFTVADCGREAGKVELWLFC